MDFFKKGFYILSLALLSAASVYCLIIFSSPISSTAKAPQTTSKVTNTQSTQSASNIEKAEEPPPQSSSQANNSEVAVETAQKNQAKGKIITKSITYADGNIKYNNVSVKNNTSLKINLKEELAAGSSIKISQSDEPQVLIMHTHTTECYMLEKREYYLETDLTRTTNRAQNITEVGRVLALGLEAKGIGVVHATETHDYPEYTGSYNRSAKTVQKYLEKHPTIKVVIDLHRDAIMDSSGTKTALCTKIGTDSAAQLMLVAGCEAGDVTGYPNWKENFRLALKLQQTIEVMYPGLARPILFTERKYNQHLTTGSLLIECGTDANTLEQAKYSATLLAECLAATLKMLG